MYRIPVWLGYFYSCSFYLRYITDQAFQGSSDSIRCCELHCIHLAIIPLNVIAYQARKLREQLWEASGVAAAAVNLL